MAVKHLGNGRLTGLSTDTKPTTYPAGSTFFEIDTGANYAYINSAWITFDFPSPRRQWGIRQGWAGNATNTNIGIGTLNAVITGNGTGAAFAAGVDGTTDGARGNHVTGTNNTFARGGWWSPIAVARKWNPTISFRFRLAATPTASNGMLYMGFVNQGTQPTAGTSMLSTYLDGKIGALFGYRPADTTWMIMSNNAIATATYTACTSLPSSGAYDNSAHTVSITLDETTPAIRWSFDGVAQTAITNTTNNVPPQTTILAPMFILEAQSATSIGIYERFTYLSQDSP